MNVEKLLRRLREKAFARAELRRAARDLGHELPRRRDPVLRAFRSGLASAEVEDPYAEGYVAALLDVDGADRPVGEGDLVAARPVAGELAGLIDSVSVSVNAFNKENYDHTCRSVFGVKAYEAIIGFVKGCVENGIKTEITCLDFVGEEAVTDIRGMAENAGATFRLRHLNVVG